MIAPTAAPLPSLGPAGEELGRTRIKICGCNSAADARLALAAGADAVGVILAPSPRRVSPGRAAEIAAELPPGVTLVAVFVDPERAQLRAAARALPSMVPQFSGAEPAGLCRWLGRPYLKVLRVSAGPADPDALAARIRAYPDALPVFESPGPLAGGSGQTFPWERLLGILPERSAVVSGGLRPDNVGACVRLLHPYAVDVRSGVEAGAAKDPGKLSAFVSAVRLADASS